MLKKTITFNDLDGNPITDDFYFNLSKAEIAEMELSQSGGLGETLQRIVKDEDGRAIIEMFKMILTTAYGQRSEDRRRFIKTPEVAQEFMQTEAYSELFMELVTDADASAAFIRGIIPADLQDKIESVKMVDVQLPADPGQKQLDFRSREEGVEAMKRAEPTQRELIEMSREELIEAMKRKNAGSQE